MYRKGDRVYCYVHQSWGTVNRVWDGDYTHPVDVTLDNDACSKSYTRDGRYNGMVCLFFRDDIEFPTPVRPFETGELLHYLPTGTIVIYDHYDYDAKQHYIRKFSTEASRVCIRFSVEEDKIERTNGLIVSNLKEVVDELHGRISDVK